MTKTQLKTLFFIVLLVMGIGYLDYLSGYEWGFSIFYVLPVYLSAKKLNLYQAITICLLSTIVWFLADKAAGHRYTHALIPYWNAFVRYLFFLIIAHSFHRKK